MPEFTLLMATFLVSLSGTWLIIYLSKSRRWLDIPNDRSSHTIPTPTSGGVAFIVVFMLATLYAFRQTAAEFNHYLLLLLCFCIAMMGLADDIFHLGIKTRISIQLLAVSGALAMFGIPVLPVVSQTIELGWAGYLLAAWALLWFINLFNFMDGIDGIVAAETIFVCLAVLIISDTESNAGLTTILLLLVAAVSGFLLFNYSPANIFMGDTGSNFLGFFLAVTGLASTTSGFTNVWVWCILAGVFIIDSSYTLFSRMIAGETWYFAHRTHGFQIAARYFESHGKVVVLILLINCLWLLPLAWLSQHYPQWGILLTLLAWVPLLLLLRFIRASLDKMNPAL